MIDEKSPMKFWCENKRYGAKVQEKLFELGYRWNCGSGEVWQPARSEYAIYTNGGNLTWGYRSGFDGDSRCEYIIDETTGVIVPVIQETQEDKSATEAVTNNNETKSLDSLFNQIVLLQKENDSLVEQKEQIINKISANTQAINILKDKLDAKFSEMGFSLKETCYCESNDYDKHMWGL